MQFGQQNVSIDISIIIVNYNSFRLLDDCLSSLIQYTKYINYEIIVVDNASSSNEVDLIRRKYPQIILIINQTNQGFAAANNKGIQTARGEYVLILNNDTIFFENTLKKIYDYVTSRNDKIILGCKILNIDKSLQASFCSFPTILNIFAANFLLYKIFPSSLKLNKFYRSYCKFEEPIEVDVVFGAFIFCSQNDLKFLNGFDESFFFYGEELDLCYRFKKTKGKVIYFPNTSIIHIGGASADKNLWFKYKNQANAYVRYYKKHFSGFGLILVFTFHYLGLLLRSLIYFLIGLVSLNKKKLWKSYYYLRQLFVYPTNRF